MNKGTGTQRAAERFTAAILRLVQTVWARPWIALSGIIFLTVVAAVYAGGSLKMETDTASMVSEDLPSRAYQAALERTFPGSGSAIVIVIDADLPDRADEAADRLAERLRQESAFFLSITAPTADRFFQRNGLLYMDRDALARHVSDLETARFMIVALAADPSLRALADVLPGLIEASMREGSGAELLAAFLDQVSDAARTAATARANPVSWSRLFSPVISEGAARRIIVVHPISSVDAAAGADTGETQPAGTAVGRIRALAAEVGITPQSGVQLRLTGGIVVSAEELRHASASGRAAGLASLVLVIVLLAVGIRSARLVFAIVCALTVGLVWTAGLATLTVGHLNPVSATFAVLFIGLGVDFGIHFAVRIREERLGPGDLREAVVRTTQRLSGVMCLCALAAALSFLSFVPTDYRGLSELGLIAGGGMFIAIVVTFTVMPAVLAVFPPKVLRTEPPLRSRKAADPRVAVAALALGCAAAATVPFAQFDLDAVKLRDPTVESVSTFRDLAATPGASPYTIDILADSLADSYDVAARLRDLPEVETVIAIASLVPGEQAEKLALVTALRSEFVPLVARAGGEIPRSSAPAERVGAVEGLDELRGQLSGAAKNSRAAGLLAALQGLDSTAKAEVFEQAVFRHFAAPLNRFRLSLEAEPVSLADLPRAYREQYLSASGRAKVTVFPSEDLKNPEALAQFVRAVRAVAPGATGSPVAIVEAEGAVTRAVIEALILAAVAISALIYWVLRSLRDTAVVVIPPILAALYTVALTVLFSIPFTIANVVVLPLLIGLGVAGGIHLVFRARDDRSISAAVSSGTSRAVALSALTTMAAFGTLALSDHPGAASIGGLLTIGIGMTLFCTLVVLPALFSLWPAGRAGDGEGR